MDTARAVAILRTLADGRDPATGAAFPPDSPYQRADTVRALHAALDALTVPPALAARHPEPNPDRPFVGKPWTPEEEDHLRTAFATGSPIKDLAEAHGRTKGAITARLLRLGLLDPTTTHSPVPPSPRPASAGSPPAVTPPTSPVPPAGARPPPQPAPTARPP